MGGLPEESDAPTHWPFTSLSVCSIFNVSQLTAAHTGSLVRNATHATTPDWQAHASVVLLLSSGLPNTPRGGVVALMLTVTECGGTGVVSVFHWKAMCPLELAGLFRRPRSLPHLAQVSRAHGSSVWEEGARREAGGFLCGCLLTGQTQRQLHCRAPYWPRWPSCGSV